MRADWTGALVGRLELPTPAGARPRSVAFPCASQLRGLLPARCEEVVLPITLAEARFELVIAEGGRFCERPRWRGVTLEALGMEPGRPVISGAFCTRALAAPTPSLIS